MILRLINLITYKYNGDDKQSNMNILEGSKDLKGGDGVNNLVDNDVVKDVIKKNKIDLDESKYIICVLKNNSKHSFCVIL